MTTHVANSCTEVRPKDTTGLKLSEPQSDMRLFLQRTFVNRARSVGSQVVHVRAVDPRAVVATPLASSAS
jgi:hypothetical protein